MVVTGAKTKANFDTNLELINIIPRELRQRTESDFQTHRTIFLLIDFSVVDCSQRIDLFAFLCPRAPLPPGTSHRYVIDIASEYGRCFHFWYAVGDVPDA